MHAAQILQAVRNVIANKKPTDRMVIGNFDTAITRLMSQNDILVLANIM